MVGNVRTFWKRVKLCFPRLNMLFPPKRVSVLWWAERGGGREEWSLRKTTLAQRSDGEEGRDDDVWWRELVHDETLEVDHEDEHREGDTEAPKNVTCQDGDEGGLWMMGGKDGGEDASGR